MEHSNSLSDGPYEGSRNNTTAHAPPLITPPSTKQRHDGISQQSRRLQLRNAGFRGPVLPSRRVSPIFGSPQPDTFIRPNNENSPLGFDKRMLYGEDMPPSPVNILQEIHNSTRRKRQAARPEISNIFQDHTATEPTSGKSGTPWYNEQSANCSPVTFNTSPINMTKLRDGSFNQKTPPPLSSPLAKHVKSRNLGRVNLRSTSFEASKYIDHLESQLTALNVKLDSLVSPSTNKARAAKLRALTVEARSLRYELADWEKNFAERVKEGVDQRLELESGLKARLEALVDDGEIKDMKIRELEFEVETLRLKTKDTEALEITNANLERRIDVLTSLLVQSPTKLDFGSAALSPGKVEPPKRTPRPRSMMSRVPSSPGGVRLSLRTVSQSSFWQGRGLRSDSSISEMQEDNGSYSDENHQTSPEPIPRDQTRDPQSPVVDTAASTSSGSVPSPSSRPTSLHSTSSSGANSWGLPLSTERDPFAKSANKQRRMRRFPSGSCSLKPLILPSAAGTPSVPASAPVYAPSDAARRDTSNFSVDPTTAFLSQHDFTSPIETPTQPDRRTSTTWAQEQTLKTLEGRSGHPDEHLEDVLLHSPLATKEGFSEAVRASTSQRERRKSRPKSLEEELKQACLEAKRSNFSGSFTDGLIPVEEDTVGATFHIEENSAGSDSIVIGIDNQSPSPSPVTSQLGQQHMQIEDDITPKPPKKPTLIDSPTKALPSTALATRSAYGLFERLTDIIVQAKQEPTSLARRLLYNAWSLGSARLGGIGWWLLGLILGHGARERDPKADVVIGEENSGSRRFDRRPCEAEASKRRTADCFSRREGLSEPLEPTRRRFGVRRRDGEAEPHIFPCDKCVEPSSRRTLCLWFRFSLTIVLAVGIAIKDGPGALLADMAPQPPPPPLRTTGQSDEERPSSTQATSGGEYSRHRGLTRTSGVPHKREQRGNRPVQFAQVLRPADFEGPRSPPASTHHWPS